MSELIVEKIAPQSEILDIKGKLKLQGNLETTGTFLSSYLNVKPNDLDISTVTINDTTGYGITFLTDNKTLELNRTNPNKGIKLHTIASSKNNSYFDTLTIGNIQGGKGSITITPDSPKGSPFSNQKDKIIINTSNLLVKDPNIPVSLSKRGNETTLAKASYNAISTGSILYLGSLPKGNKSLDITNEYVSGLYTGYRSIKPGAVVVRNNFHSIGGLTHIHGKLKVGMGTAELDGTTGGYLNLHHFTGNNSLGNLDEDYEGAIIIRSGKRDLTQAAILIAIRDGDYGEDIQDEYHSVIQELSEPISWNFENAILNYQAEYDISPQNIEYTFNEPTQVVDEEFINLFETIPETELIGVPLEYMWEDMYTGATTLEEAQNQALQDKFLNTDSEFYIGVDGHSGRDSQPNIISRGSLTIGLDGRKSIVGSERNSFFEIISGINDVENHADATTLFNINNVNKKTFVQHLSSSGQLFASMSDASTNSDDQLRQHVIVVDTASGQFFITGSYGGSSTEDGKKVGFPYSGSDVVVTNNPEGSQAVITGSLFLSGSGNITASGHISSSHFYGDLTGTASYVKTASYVIGDIEGTASWALNASESVSASFASSSNSASYATNATSADTASYVQNALTKFLSLTDVDTTFNYGAIGSDFESFTPQIGAMEAAPAFGITEDTVEGQFTGLPGFIPVVNSEGTKLQLSKKVASASFADNVKNATTAFTGGKFTQGNDNSQLPNLTTEGLSDKFQMPAGFHAHGLNSTIVGNLSISGSLGVSDSITIADIQISASDGAFSFGTGSDNTITHQMTGNLSLSASTGITVNMPSNVIGFHGTASYAKTASYAINGGEGGVGFPYSGSDVVVTGNPEGSQAVITGSLFLSSSGNITASGHISSSHFYGDLTGTASYATNASESVSASYAETASYVIGTIEGTASWALNASESVSASFASSSTSASYADTASYIFGTIEGTASWALNASESVSASFASSSTSASFASSSTSASFASSSTSASFASSSTSASFASSSTSASYAKTASYIIGDVEGTASWALNASESVSASFASTSFSASYAKNVSLNFTHLTDVPSGNGENDIAAIAAVNTYPNQTHNFAVVVDGEGTALAFVKAVKSASFASGSDSASYAQNATLAETASFASNVATKFTDLKDVDSSLTEDAANPEGDTNLSGLADYVIAVEPIGNKLRAVKTVKSASFAVRSFSASFASSSTSASFASSSTSASFALTSFSASFASSSDSASYAKTASYISSADVADLDFLDLEDTTDAYGNEGDVLVLESDTLIFKSASNSASFASSSNSASFASSSTSASFASSSTSASFASSSTSASFASSSTSASFASTSFSASYAIKSTTASYVIGDIEGTSSFAKTSSYAISGGFSESGFFAWKTLIQGDLTVSGSVGIVGGGLTINDIQVSSSQGGFTFGSGSENNINHQMTGNLQLSSSVGITANMPNNTVGFHGTASHASRSVSASYAETASYVIGTIEGTASWALNASESVSSSFASSSTSASFASSSTSASFASSSTSASFASSSTSASFASSSTSASFASSSTSASFASSSTSASYAKTASYVIGTIEGTASWALNASESVSASFASSSTSASFASSSTSASYAKTASYIIGDVEGTASYLESFLSMSDTPESYDNSGSFALQVAPNSNKVSFVKAVDSASFASGSDSASYAKSASYISASDIDGTIDTTFLDLTDTPATYIQNYALQATNASTLEFVKAVKSASFASSSTSASFASSSTSASFASSSNSASFASSSTSASFASSSTSASFASSSTSASFASTSFSASYASRSTTASYALNAQNAEGGSFPYSGSDVVVDSNPPGTQAVITGSLFLTSSGNITASGHISSSHFYGDLTGTASYAADASESVSASYAETASYIIGDVEGTASWALNASESVSASYASMSQEIYVNTTFGNTVAFQIGDKAEGTPTDAAPGGGTSGENLHPILFASDISKGKLNVANGNGYTDVGVTQSLRYDTYHERLLVKRFKSTLSTGTGFEGTASWADKVLSASFASSSTSASYASSSTSASFASSSTSASFASSSTSASFASSSTSASFASSSTSASFASSSTSASFASSSTSASYASQSETASYVESASFATLAISGGFSSKPFHVVNDLDVMGDIMVSGSVSIGAGLTISNVQISSSTDAFTFGTGSTNNITHQMTGNLELSASVGITANMSADTIGFHGTASWADKVLSASFASSSTSASFASSSTSASFASMSFSASFASTSFSASYAKTASYVIGDIEGTASWALNASESVSASFASSSTSASFASSSTSASFASMSFSASYASSSTSASYASSSTSASYANNTDKAERAVSASFASNSAEIFVTNYAKSALLNDNDKVHLTFVTKPDYNTTNPTITDDVPEGGVPYDAATMSKLYAFGQPAHKGLTYTPSEDLLHTTTSFALTASHALNASTNYIDLTDTEDTNYTDKSGFVPVVKENSTLPNDGVLTLLQTVPSASIAFSSSYALTASYVEGADGGNANTAETANTVLIVSEGEGFHRLIMVDQNNDFGDGEPESLQETDGLIWNGLERRLGINTFKPATELHLRGVEYIEGGTFQWTQHIPVSTPTGPNTVSVNTTLPNQIQNHPYNSGNINTNKHKPGIILPLGVGIYSIDTTNNNPTSPVNNGLLPWSNLITHREDKGVIDIGDPYSANMIDMNFYVGSRRSGNFYFNPHASTQPNLFDTTDPLGGPFSTSLNNPIPTLQIVQGKPISSNTSANTFHGSVGIRCRKGFLQDSTNALYVRGTTILGDSLVVNRMYSGNGIDTYDPKSPIPPTGVETLYNLAGPNHFEIHPPVETPSISSKFISAIRFKVDPDTMASTYQIDHQMDRSGYIIYNNATSQCDISFKTITTIPESLNPVVSGPIPTDRLHIDNLSGTVTIGATNFTNGYNWGLVGSGNVSENPPEHKKYKFVVNGPSLMNGNLIITGSSNSSGYNGKYLGYPLLKVDTMDTSDSGNFIVQFENKDITSPKILNLISHDKDARGATFISFKNIDPNGNETERGSIKSTTGGNTISYNTTSDRRLKTNIKSTNELDKLLELNPVTYNWKKGNTKDIGLIAQEVDEIYPHLVDKSNEETLQMNYIGLVPILLSGIKEQQKMIDSLEERIKKLENK